MKKLSIIEMKNVQAGGIKETAEKVKTWIYNHTVQPIKNIKAAVNKRNETINQLLNY